MILCFDRWTTQSHRTMTDRLICGPVGILYPYVLFIIPNSLYIIISTAHIQPVVPSLSIAPAATALRVDTPMRKNIRVCYNFLSVYEYVRRQRNAIAGVAHGSHGKRSFVE